MSYTTTRRKTSSEGVGWMFAIFLLVIAPITLFNGWMLSVMWNWFVPNIFHNMPSLTIGEAIGLSLVISAFLYIPSKDDEDKDPWVHFITILLTPIIRGFMLLGIGVIVHSIVF